MAMMNAAVVTSFDEPPHYQPFEVPQPADEAEILVDVLAVGLHPRVRTGAAGAHYTSRRTLPMIPGVDGVGRRQDGRRIYFAAGSDVIGTMADKAVVDIVIDDVGGRRAERAIRALLNSRADRSRAMNWIQSGAMAGPTIELPSVALRSANFRLQGNGQGAVSTAAYLAELPSLVREIDTGTIAVKANTVPLADVEAIWTRSDPPGERTVLVP